MEEFQFKSDVWVKQQQDPQEIIHYDIQDQQTGSNSKEEFEKLKTARDRFNIFLQQIKNNAMSPLRPDVLSYCESQKKSLEEKMKPENIMKKIEIRIDKMLKTRRIKRNWGTEDLCILIWIISKYCDFKGIENLEKDIVKEDWDFIATLIPGVSGESCMFKWLSIKKVTLANYNWSRKESDLLAKIVKEKTNYNENAQIKDWKEVSQILYRSNHDPKKVYRNAKQCREHWTCYLSPQLKKGPWQLYQDVKLLKFIKDNKGLKKWSQIAKYFEGRTQNALKNRYTLIIQKQKKPQKNRHKSQLQLISEFLQKCYVDSLTTNNKYELLGYEENIYEEDGSKDQYIMEDGYNKIPFHKKEYNIDTGEPNEIIVTPMKVQKLNLQDFQAMSLTFFRSVKPGVMDSDGIFKRMEDSSMSMMKGISLFSQEYYFDDKKNDNFEQEE